MAAPAREQSGVGASMTRHAPLFAHEAPAAQYLRQFAPDDATPPRAAAVWDPAPPASSGPSAAAGLTSAIWTACAIGPAT